MAKNARVFISYAHDSEPHKAKALELANRLRADGVEAHIDRYYENEPVDWPKWMQAQIKLADFVLCIGSPLYLRRVDGDEETGKGRGAKWEGAIITQFLYESEGNNKKMIPVVFAREDEANIPLMLRGTTRFLLEDEHGYESLFRRLTEQPRIVMPPVGTLRILSTEAAEPAPAPSVALPEGDAPQAKRTADSDREPVLPKPTERANKVLKLAYTGRAETFCERLALLDSDEQVYVIGRLLEAKPTNEVVSALGCVAANPPAVVRLGPFASQAMTAVVLSDDVGALATMMSTWPESALALASKTAREAFFREVIRIMLADQYSDVNRITPAVVKVQRSVPESLASDYIGALIDQARSGAFQGRPAAQSALANLPEPLARVALAGVDEAMLLFFGAMDWFRRLVQNHKEFWPEERRALFSEYLDQRYEAFAAARTDTE